MAGHAEQVDEDGNLVLIDNHGAAVTDAVWALYARVLLRTGPIPTLIEWDSDVPAYAVLSSEAHAADLNLDALQNVHDGIAA